ncbi:4-hydroxy-tetrahydrodipicolinate synthase [Clostridium estertheticum]|uniref:4-hydroxy-tetrahydrodipicolinate synthase n=1 Tax=Clostridium estertheticum TaxID=238834 RepID=A0A5N7IV61_9CLOT|nr:4-hydroxy-tetrahydrodipicolinate synthase [Clostridium estertheticum]MPQ34179.1 4-hydroxy-tetrahydrodipicolinate synthase [Clostridium estertheticum]MPQ64602.1 4-hydroxy-tetrahydrodipicolinate synthase [Clostridium estertheticum]
MAISGVFIPLVTPFKDGNVDYVSYKKLIDYYLTKGVHGFIPLGTTSEGPTISDFEYEEIIEKTIEYTNGSVPIYVGLGGNNTKKVVEKLKVVEKYKIDGILSVSPYYSRPDQRGIFQHFKSISEATYLDIIVYNIPYRTGRNIENTTIRKLAELNNIVGIKDSSGNIAQTTELILNKPKNFSILTGEDALFYTTLCLGGDGGILASAHINTEGFIKVYNDITSNNSKAALETWKELYEFIPMLFQEPNPAPLKYCLKKLGLIDSSEVRLPLVEITEELQKNLNTIIKSIGGKHSIIK